MDKQIQTEFESSFFLSLSLFCQGTFTIHFCANKLCLWAYLAVMSDDNFFFVFNEINKKIFIDTQKITEFIGLCKVLRE